MKKIDIPAGTKFNRLTAVGPDVASRVKREWLCECGNTHLAFNGVVFRGVAKSCGCLKRQIASRNGKLRTTHGGTNTPTFRSWMSAITRCRDPNATGYKNYGGRGISVCDRWAKFEFFLEDMGHRPSMSHTLDRKDSNKNYEPGNCRWATWNEQAQNRRNSKFVLLGGKQVPMSEAARMSSVSDTAFRMRMKKGMSPEEAVSTPRSDTRRPK